jgi:hypothetical protein
LTVSLKVTTKCREMLHNVTSTHIGHFGTKTEGRTVEKELKEIEHKKKEKVDEEMVLHVASTHPRHVATKTE